MDSDLRAAENWLVANETNPDADQFKKSGRMGSTTLEPLDSCGN